MPLSREDERAVRRRLLITLVIMTMAGAVLIALAAGDLRRGEYNRWVTIAVLAIGVGLSVMYNMWHFPFEPRYRLARVAMMAFPGAWAIFGGIATLAAEAGIDWLLFTAGVLTLAAFFVGFGIVCWHLVFVLGK